MSTRHAESDLWDALRGALVTRALGIVSDLGIPQALANGCLHVVVDNSPWLHELTLRAAELTARLRAQSPAVRSLRFTLGTLETEPRSRPERREERRAAALTDDDRRDIHEAASAIPDPALAEAARRLLTTARRFPVGARGPAR